jgi:2-dehydro-3-deoxyphosphogluconate aldolase/(4S)-4-hydroxy-2-oxoglutarate aldolase
VLDTFGAATERVTARLREVRLVPVVELPSPAAAVPLVEALAGGGLDCVEITFRTPAAREGLALVRDRFPEVLLGAGTVLSLEQVDAAVSCGADFVVSPGTNPAVVDACRERGVPVLPGVCTPTEIELARSRGLRTLKFFPAEAMGGVGFLKALSGPYRDVAFVPTGGISPENLAGYLRLPHVVACGGSWMVKPEVVAAGDFDRVRRLASEAVAVASGVR